MVGLGSLGWGFGNGLRAEVEGNYRHNDIRRSAPAAAVGTSGHFRTYGVMANVLYDFNLGMPVVPYIGGGVGYGWTESTAPTWPARAPPATASTTPTAASPTRASPASATPVGVFPAWP